MSKLWVESIIGRPGHVLNEFWQFLGDLVMCWTSFGNFWSVNHFLPRTSRPGFRVQARAEGGAGARAPPLPHAFWCEIRGDRGPCSPLRCRGSPALERLAAGRARAEGQGPCPTVQARRRAGSGLCAPDVARPGTLFFSRTQKLLKDKENLITQLTDRRKMMQIGWNNKRMNWWRKRGTFEQFWALLRSEKS